MDRRKTSEKPLREWFDMDHNSNVEIERRHDSVSSTVAIQYQKIYGVSDRRGTRDDEFEGRGDSRDRQRERPYERERGDYEPPRVVVARTHGVPASYGNASNPPPHRHEGFANPPPPPAARSAWDRGRAPNLSSAAAPFYPGAGHRPSAAPMGSLPYGGGGAASMASMASMSSMKSMASMAPMASAARGAAPSAPSARSAPSAPPKKYVRPSRYDAYDTDRDDDSDTDPEEARRRRESLARDPSRRPRDAPGEPPSEDARRRRSGSESLSRRDSLGARASQGALGASRALPIPKTLQGAGTHAASRVSGILNAIPGPGRLSAPKPMMPVGAAAAPRVKDTGFEERARALADEKKRKAAEAAAAEAAEAEAERAAAKRARLAKEAKEAARAVPKPEPKTIEVSDDDGADDELRVTHDDDDRQVVRVELDDDSGSDVAPDDDTDDEARRERRRAAKKLKKEKKRIAKKMPDASEKAEKEKFKASEKSVEERQAEPIAPLGGKFPDDAVWIIHNDKYPAYHLFARDVYVQRLYRNAPGGGNAKDTPDLCIRRFKVKVSEASDPEYTEVSFENTDPTGKAAKGKSTRILRSMLALFRWAAREWGRDSDDLKQFFKEYSNTGNTKSFKDTMDGKV